MNMLSKITKAKITRTENELTLEVFPIWAIMSLYSLVFLGLVGLRLYNNGFDVIISTFFLLVIFSYSFSLVRWLVYKFHSYNLGIIGGQQQAILPDAPKFSNAILTSPFFIDFYVTTAQQNITVLIENQGQKLGLFRLASANDLSVIIDGFTELLDLELVDSYKLSNKELLSFKSKQKAIAPYSALQVMELKDNLMIRSVIKQTEELKFDFINKKIQNRQQTFDFNEIQKVLIVNYEELQQVAIQFKTGQKEIVFKNKTTEITAIRDAKRLQTILEKQAELGEIEIKMVSE